MYKAVESISKYRSSNNLIDDIYIYFKNTDLILTYSGKYDPEFFYQQYLQNKEYGYSQWKGDLQNFWYKQYSPSRRVLKWNNTKTIIDYRQSLPFIERSNTLGTAVIMMDTNNIYKLLNRFEMFSNGEVYVLDNSQNIIMSIGKGAYKRLALQNTMLTASQLYFDRSTHREFVISSVTSGYNGWRYISVAPTNILMQKVNYIKVLTIVIIAVELVLGLGLSFLLARRNYKPIRQLMEKLGTKAGNNLSAVRNELTFIEEITAATFAENEKIKTAMAGQQPIIRTNTLMQLLKGNINDLKNIRESLSTLGISFIGNIFCVLTVNVDDSSQFVKDGSLEQKAMIKFVITNVIEELVNNEYKSYSVDMDLDRISIIIDLNREDSLYLKKLYQISDDAKGFIAQKFLTQITIGIGSMHEGVKGISATYNESIRAMEYKMVRGTGSVIAFEDICNVTGEYIYPAFIETQLLNHIKAGDLEKVEALLDSLFSQNFKNSNISIEMARCLFFDIMSTALKVLNDVSIEYESIFNRDFSPLNKILSCQTADEMHITLKDLYKSICEYINLNRKSHNAALKSRILDYLHENYSNSALSLTSAADALDLNPSYLSYFFKKQKGENFIDYLNKIRIEKAKELLQNTSLPLFEISSRVGYTNYSGLIRIFKKYEGITPGLYRENIQSGVLQKNL